MSKFSQDELMNLDVEVLPEREAMLRLPTLPSLPPVAVPTLGLKALVGATVAASISKAIAL
jgi:hypothetical protein